MSVKAENGADTRRDNAMFANQKLLDPVFERLYQLENNRAWKVNIVHLGDSHIQADFLTNAIRESLQAQFDDGGYGFTFPYSLIKTNGTNAVKYSSNTEWKGRLNVLPITEAVDIGLSGIGLYTDIPNFNIQLNTDARTFNSIKVLYSTKEPQYDISLTLNPTTKYIEEKVIEEGEAEHRIRRGESLSVIAAQYETTIEAIKLENSLSSDNIQAGRILRIPNSSDPIQATKKIIRKQVDYVDSQSYPYYTSYLSADPLNRISIFSKPNTNGHDISGFILENDRPGLVYHTIGVNGAKMSDFSKYPLFFKQLNILQPDLVVVSFGTNESYLKLTEDNYINKLEELINKIKEGNPSVSILVITPPPSLIRRRDSNTLIKKYSEVLMNLPNVTVWDLYNHMGGDEGIRNKGKFSDIIAGDKIHYTLNGYKVQGELFSKDFMKAYNEYKKRREG